jgi:hypothetical protein
VVNVKIITQFLLLSFMITEIKVFYRVIMFIFVFRFVELHQD